MATVDWADEPESDEEPDVINTAAEIQQDRMLSNLEGRSSGASAPREQRRDQAPRHQGDRDGGRGGRPSYNRDGGGDRPPRQQRERQPLDAANINDTGPFVLYVGNLNFKTKAQGLGMFFVDGGCAVKDVNLAEDESGRPRGYGHVAFETRESLVEALQADGAELDGRNIRVDIDAKSRKRDGRSGDGHAADGGDPWARGASRAKLPPAREGRDSGRGGDRDRGGRGDYGGSSGGDFDGPIQRGLKVPAGDRAAKPERKKLNLTARTVPLEDAGAPSTAGSSIFGDAKPRDAAIFEKPEKSNSFRNNKKDRSARDVRKEDQDGTTNTNTNTKDKNGGKDKDKDRAKVPLVTKSKPAVVDTTPIPRNQRVEGKGGKGGSGNNSNNNNTTTKKEGDNEKKAKSVKASDGLTDEERFLAAQDAMSKSSVTTEVKKNKPQNVFAAAFDSDSD